MFTKESSKTELLMAKELKNGTMVTLMSATGSMDKKTEQESSLGPTATLMKESGKIASQMERERRSRLKVMFMKDI